MTETIVNKLRLKNIIAQALDEILKPEHKDIRKRATLSLLILIIAVLGVHFSIGLMTIGVKILLESGVSKVLIQQAVGSGVCIAGIVVLLSYVIGPAWALGNIFREKKE